MISRNDVQMFSPDANNPIWIQFCDDYFECLNKHKKLLRPSFRVKSNSHLQFFFGEASWIISSTKTRHDRANDKGNFDWMNTLLTIIKGSVFSQYDVHNAASVIWCPLFVPSGEKKKSFTICSRSFWCFSIRIICFFFHRTK